MGCYKNRKTEHVSSEELNNALNVIRRDYYNDVANVCDDVVTAIKNGEITDSDKINDRLSEAVDSTQRVIYTFEAELGVAISNNSGAYEDEIGEKPPTAEAQCAYAMIRDAYEMLGDLDELIETYAPKFEESEEE